MSGSKEGRLLSERRGAVALGVVPLVLMLLIFQAAPVLYALYLSIHNWNYTTAPEFVGLSHYAKALLHDPVFLKSVFNTLIYLALVVPTGNVLSLLLAIQLNRMPRFQSIYRMLFFLPVITNMVAISLLWRWIYDPSTTGLLNQFIGLFGLHPFGWLNSTATALPCIAFVSMWSGLGYSLIIYEAGIKEIPDTFYEAAYIDGAGAVSALFHITIPLLIRTISFSVITGTISALQVFTEVLIMSPDGDAGPLNSTRSIVFHLYRAAFDSSQMGYACALAFTLLGMIAVLTVVQFRLTRVKWEY